VIRPDREQDKESAQDLVRWLAYRQLTTPAVLLLEATKPVGFLISQALLLGEPLLGFLFGSDRIAAYADLLAEPDNVERLIGRLAAETEGSGGRVEP